MKSDPEKVRGVYYNEHDPYAAQWLRNLIARGLIPAGDVDERSVRDVSVHDLLGYAQCHFFAGIGGWPYALRLAGWDDGRPVWTGSCPCQPFSAAGKGLGESDERHLWPALFRLISECRPTVVFGEQVASRAALEWLDAVCDDLEGAGYAVGAADLCAASVGAPHIRQRLFWVAYYDGAGRGEQRLASLLDGERPAQRHDADGCGPAGAVADPVRPGRPAWWPVAGARQAAGECVAMADANVEGLEGCAAAGHGGNAQRQAAERGGAAGPWSRGEWFVCRDGKSRLAEPGVFPLAHGISGRVGRLRAYGNAIVPQVAAQFVRAACTS